MGIFSMKQFIIATIGCILVLQAAVESRSYIIRRQDQQQQQQFANYEQQQGQQYQQGQQQQQGEIPFQQQSGQVVYEDNVDDDDDQLLQLAVQEAESNPDIVTQDLNEQELAQFGQDLNKYEELGAEAEIAGHKGSITKQDVEHVQVKNEKKPWYLRLKNWAGKKLNQLTDHITNL